MNKDKKRVTGTVNTVTDTFPAKEGNFCYAIFSIELGVMSVLNCSHFNQYIGHLSCLACNSLMTYGIEYLRMAYLPTAYIFM